MKNDAICLCYHPTKILFVDDNQDYIKKITRNLKKNYAFYSAYHPAKAVDYFKNVYRLTPFIPRCSIKLSVHELEDIQRDHLTFFEINLKLISQEIFRAERFEEIAVAIIDYAMPDMNGLELSQQLKELCPMLRIILLTGEADEELAIQAFNNGMINQYIKKSNPELKRDLLKAIEKLEREYFLNLSKSITDKASELGQFNRLARLQDPKLIAIFNRICEEKQIIEYYLLDDMGGYLLVDKDGKPYWLGLKNAQEIHADYFHAQYSDEVVAPAILEALKNKQKILFFSTDEEMAVPACDWAPYLHPATIVEGKETYYYALIQQPSPYPWDPSKIVTYQHYLNNC